MNKIRSQTQPETTGKAVQYHTETLSFQTNEGPEFIEITDLVQEVVDNADVQEGKVFVFSKHTTAGIVIQENEPLLLEDFESFLEEIAPEDATYRHNNFEIRTVNMNPDECENGHSHCRHLTIGPSEHLPVSEGEVVTGEWQEIFLLELDRPRDREVVVQVNGV